MILNTSEALLNFTSMVVKRNVSGIFLVIIICIIVVVDTTMRAGISQDDSDLLCPPGFVSGVLNVVMTQRWASCHQMIQTGELLRGRKYHIVMRWRPDIRPLTPFPSLLDPVWTSLVPREIIVPGYLTYFGSTAAQVPCAAALAGDDLPFYIYFVKMFWFAGSVGHNASQRQLLSPGWSF